MKSRRKLKWVTKEQIIEAIKTEPLVPGRWVQSLDDGNECGVCAVGAVLRRAGYKNIEIDDYGLDLKWRFPLGKLSGEYEMMIRTNTFTIARLVSWVKKNMPNRIRL